VVVFQEINVDFGDFPDFGDTDYVPGKFGPETFSLPGVGNDNGEFRGIVQNISISRATPMVVSDPFCPIWAIMAISRS